jgi:hypothetical protein
MVYDISLYEELFDKLSLAISNIESQGYDTSDIEGSYNQALDLFNNAKLTEDPSDFLIAFNNIGTLITALNEFIADNDIYIGSHDCCCVIAEASDTNNNIDVDLTWVWLVSSRPYGTNGDGQYLPLVPYYAGVGKKPQKSVVCAIRNPNEEGETEVLIKSLSYPSNESCATIIQERINSWDGTIPWESTTDGFSIIPYTSCEERKTITCPCKPREGVCDVELIECSEITEEDLNYFINLKHVNPFNNCEVVWKWIVQEVGNSSNRVELPAGTGLIAQNKLNHGVLSGKNYRIQLTYDHIDGSDGLIVFDQTLFVPYCPQFDMTMEALFSDTQYGQTSIGVVNYPTSPNIQCDGSLASWDISLPFIGTVTDDDCHDQYAFYVPESTSNDSDLNIRRINVGDTNPYGQFSLTLEHKPNTNNNYWNALAANIDDYQWVWQLAIYNNDETVILTKTSGTSSNGHPTANGKVSIWNPTINLFDENGGLSLPNNFKYKARLEAYKNGQLIKHAETPIQQNQKHKGTRVVESITANVITPNNGHYFNLVLGNGVTGNVNREIQYRPALNFSGDHTESFNVILRKEDNSTQTLTHDVTFVVQDNETSFNGVHSAGTIGEYSITILWPPASVQI